MKGRAITIFPRRRSPRRPTQCSSLASKKLCARFQASRSAAGRHGLRTRLIRETEAAIESARDAGVLAVEMEAAALYAFATAKSRSDMLPT